MAKKKTIDPGAEDTILFFKDKQNQWRWHRVTPEGEIVGGSTEGYTNFKDCRANFNRQGIYTDNIDVEVL